MEAFDWSQDQGLLTNGSEKKLGCLMSRSVVVAVFWHLVQLDDLVDSLDAVAFLRQCHLDQPDIFPKSVLTPMHSST